MKILIIQESDWLDRGPHQQHHLADRLSLRGHKVHVIDYEILWQEKQHGLYSKRSVFEHIWKIDPAASVTVIRPGIIKIPLLNYISLVFSHHAEIKRQIKEFKPDVIVGFGILNNYIALRLARQAGIPFIHYWIDVLYRLIPLKIAHFFGQWLERQLVKDADKVLTINEKLRDYVIDIGAPRDTEVIGAGIDLNKFQPSPVYSNTRKEYGFKETDIVLFFMGWIYNFSGVKEVAMQLSQQKASNVKLLVVGEGDAYSELKSIRDKFNMQESLILTGKRPYSEMPTFLSASDICILPAYPQEQIMQDIVPIKLYEYMAMQKPVICTKLPGIYKEFGEGNGIVYTNQPEETIAKAIELTEGGIINDLGGKAHKFVQKYDWEILTDRFLKVLEEVIQKKDEHKA